MSVVSFPASPTSATLIPDGEYRIVYCRHSLRQRFQRDVLEVWFTVADYGAHFDQVLPRYYSVQASAKRRSFKARPNSAFVREYFAVVGRRPDFSAAPLEAFRRGLIVARVGTVTRDHEQKKLLEPLQYSTIRALLRREDT